MRTGVQFDHLGIVVKSVAKGRKALTEVLSIRDWTAEIRDPVNGVLLQFGRDPAGVVYEVLEPLDEKSPVYNALATGKGILNHIAYRVSDLAAHAAAMRRAGCAPTSEPKPAVAYGGRNIQFFITPLRLIIELIEAPDHVHRYLAPGTAEMTAAESSQ
jgi:methylmalonyl-CoA/ethylmalonyl-CoA epimerase